MHKCLQCDGTGDIEDYGGIRECEECNGKGELMACQCSAWCSCECGCGAWDGFECNCWEEE